MSDMLGDVIKQLVRFSPHLSMPILYDLFEKLLGGNGDFWWYSLRKFLRQEPCFVKEKRIFFDHVETVKVPIDTSLNLQEFFNTGNNLLHFDSSNHRRPLGLATDVPHESIVLEVRQMKEQAHRIEFRNDLPGHFEINPTDFFYALASEIIRMSKGEDSEVLDCNIWRSFYIQDHRVSVRWWQTEGRCSLSFEKHGGREEVGRLIYTRVTTS